MTVDEATIAVIDALEALTISYMLVGSYSSNYYGRQRVTNNADFVVQLGSWKFSDLISRLGPGFRADPQMSFETATFTIRNVIELVGSTFAAELFHLSDDAHDQERFRRRGRVALLDREVWMPTA